MAQPRPAAKPSIKVDPDAFYAITVVWKSGISYQVPCRGRQLQSHLTRCAENVWLQSFKSRVITQDQYLLLMYGAPDDATPSVPKVRLPAVKKAAKKVAKKAVKKVAKKVAKKAAKKAAKKVAKKTSRLRSKPG
jgi:hypothetical protein